MGLPVLTSFLSSGCFHPHQSLLLLRGVEQEVGSILSSAESKSPPKAQPRHGDSASRWVSANQADTATPLVALKRQTGTEPVGVPIRLRPRL